MKRFSILLLFLLIAICSAVGAAGSAADDSEDMAALLARAETGDPQALYDVGSLYYRGHNVEHSFETAASYFERAADLGVCDAQRHLATLYFTGTGVEQSWEKAIKYYTMAADQGDAEAQEQLGRIYAEGLGADQSYENAAVYYELAAQQGQAEAQNSIAGLYLIGIGVEQSYEKALKYYELAAEQGNEEAQDTLGALYYEGLDIDQSLEKALRYTQLAADQGNAHSLYRLGQMYENGEGVEQSEETAFMYYQLAADQGLEYAADKVSGAKYYGTMMVDNCKEWVSLRKSPSKKAKRLAKVPLFDIVFDAEWKKEYGDFIYCNYDGNLGYILSDYLVPWSDPETEESAAFVSRLGFSLQYDPSLFYVSEDYSESGESILIEADIGNSPVYLEILALRGFDESAGEFLEDKAPENAEYDADQTRSGHSLRWFQETSHANPDLMQTYYAVDNEENPLAAVATWPKSDNAYWLGIFTDLMMSIEFPSSSPVHASFSKASDQALVVDEDGEYVMIRFDEAVTQAAILGLDLSFQDTPLYETHVLQELGSIAKDTSIVIQIAFPGDVPCYGIQYTDADGAVHRFDIGISGLDGSLEMLEF